MVEQATAERLTTTCITFDPDPEAVLRPERQQLALSTVEDRTRRLKSLGLSVIDVVRFNRAVAQQTPEEFISGLQARYDLRALWVGTDFALGRERTGTIPKLEAMGAISGFRVVVIEPLLHDGRRIAATWIRDTLAEGNVALAADLLGRPYCVSGPVVAGMSRGRQLGFPTANVVPPAGHALPGDGVYLARASATPPHLISNNILPDDRYALINLGPRPTFDEHERLIETHLLDFDGDLYGAQLEVCFLERVRAIRRFAGIDELRDQIGRDVATARELIARLPQALKSYKRIEA
jgi:riboflavin kinase/FMN adenylyltransferase